MNGLKPLPSPAFELTVEEKPTGEISAGAGIGTDGGSFAINIQENNDYYAQL